MRKRKLLDPLKEKIIIALIFLVSSAMGITLWAIGWGIWTGVWGLIISVIILVQIMRIFCYLPFISPKDLKYLWSINEYPRRVRTATFQNASAAMPRSFVLQGLCSCDRCGKDVSKGEGCLNGRNSRLYCNGCWSVMKSNDPGGEELPLGETWHQGVQRTSLVWS
jgi:hypothetical protein